jgi:hypothetical protein
MQLNHRGKQVTVARKHYTIAYKIAIVARGEKYGKKAVARAEGINWSLMKKWNKTVNDMKQFAATRGKYGEERFRSDGNGRPPLIKKEVEDGLIEWFEFLRNEETGDGPLKVDINMCIQKIRQLDPELNNIQRGILRRRIWRIFRCRKITDRAITHQQQKSRSCKKMIEGFSLYIQKKMKILEITHKNICNFDETNVFFAPQSKKTLAAVGSQTVAALIAESSQRCTAMIGVAGNGDGFEPYVIFKGKDTPEEL